ncbi:MAG: short-chain fatty acid transporter [Deltaproteobacteria bacterium]|nr:short-chain fatty acid transporter [Deltaproteobacteria bacterium]
MRALPIAAVGAKLSRVASKVVPDPFVLALGLTLLVGVFGAILLADEPPEGGVVWTLIDGWATGFASPGGLAFALQMCLVLVTGHALATSPPVQRWVRAIASKVRGAAGAAFVVSIVACLAAVIHWGLGAIVGAFLAREIGRNSLRDDVGPVLHYPLLGAAAYAGLAVWHGGLSGSAPLKVAEPGHFAADAIRTHADGIVPVTETLLSPLNFVVTGVLCLGLPVLFAALTPSDEDRTPPDPEALRGATPKADPEEGRFRFERSRAVGVLVGLVGLGTIGAAWATGRMSLDLNLVNFLFLFAGVALQGSLRGYVDAITDGAKGAGGIILQFPFYFGILGIMKAAGLITWISEAMVAVADADTFPVLAFFSAGIVNLMVPSGGGQWAVQGDILLGAGDALGVPPGTTVMAFAYGDAWTNTLQPFWALPLLGIMGLEAKSIVGYTAVACIAMGIVVPVLLLVLG